MTAGRLALRGLAVALIATSAGASQGRGPIPAVALDHILIGAPDLDRAIGLVERRTGVRATYGGSHPDVGTRNALVALGDGAYLEIIAPDPTHRRRGEFGKFVASLPRMTALGWAYRTDDLAGLRSGLRAKGVHVEPIERGSRGRPDGRTLHWATFEIGPEEDVSPFFIEWNRASPHPSASAARGCRLAEYSFGGPMKPNVARALTLVGQAPIRKPNAPPRLHVTLQCRRGAMRF